MRQFYSKRHFERVSPRADTQAEIDARKLDRAIAEQAHAEMERKFTPITPENFRAATEFQNQRIWELRAETCNPLLQRRQDSAR